MTSKPVRVGIAGQNDLDPQDIYYTHSKIRPFFSGCGKRIVDTIAEIESGKITVQDLPQISVIQDLEGNTFCLNNRRLYVFKHIRRMGLLENNTVSVRVKKAIPREMAKYSTEKCSLNCVILREKAAWTLEKEDMEQSDTKEEDTEGNTGTATTTASSTTTSVGTENNSSVEVIATATGTGGGVSFKNDKKKLKTATDETDEERYLRQKLKISEAKQLYEKQAAERLQRKAEKEALLVASGGSVESEEESEEDDDDDDEEEEEQDLFICNICSKEFKSVEQIEQHFNSKAHKKLVQDEFKRKREAERKQANRAAAKQKKSDKAAALAAAGGVSSLSLSSLPPPPPVNQTKGGDDDHDEEEEDESDDDDDSSSSSNSSCSECSEEEDDDLMLLQMAAGAKRSKQGLPGVDSGSDSD